jgi:amino acid transporter
MIFLEKTIFEPEKRCNNKSTFWAYFFSVISGIFFVKDSRYYPQKIPNLTKNKLSRKCAFIIASFLIENYFNYLKKIN